MKFLQVLVVFLFLTALPAEASMAAAVSTGKTIKDKITGFLNTYCNACKKLGGVICSRPLGARQLQKLKQLEAQDTELSRKIDDLSPAEQRSRKRQRAFARTRSVAGYLCKNLCKKKVTKYLGSINNQRWWLELSDLTGLEPCMKAYLKMPAARDSYLKKLRKAKENRVVKIYTFSDAEYLRVIDKYLDLISLSDFDQTVEVRNAKEEIIKELTSISEHIRDNLLIQETPFRSGLSVLASRIKKKTQKTREKFQSFRARRRRQPLKQKEAYGRENLVEQSSEEFQRASSALSKALGAYSEQGVKEPLQTRPRSDRRRTLPKPPRLQGG